MLIGHGSSGTSILAMVMRKYLQICFGTETQFVINYYRRLPRYGDLSETANMRRLLKDVLSERFFVRSKKFGFEADEEDICSRIEQPTLRGLIDAIFASFCVQSEMDRWGDKSPEYTYDLDVLGELFPDAKYIHIVRDGRDVANSTAGRYWGPKNAYVSACDWNEAIANVLRFTDRLPADKVMEVRYEDLLTHPVDVFRRLIEFLDVDDADGKLIAYIEANIKGELNRGNFNKWQSRWSSEEQRRFERIACESLRRFSYETTLTRCDNTFSSAERFFWKVDNKLRKWAYPGYWMDNVYRGQLRLRNLFRSLRRSGS